MKITVTAEDIAQGEPKDAIYCPVARALTRVWDRPAWVCWGTATYFADRAPDSSLEFPTFLVSFKFDLPDQVNEFIERFDEGDTVEPFEFDIADEGVMASYE